MNEQSRPKTRLSLAGRLTLWYASSTCLIVIAATGLLYWALISHLDRQDDQFLIDEVHILRDLLAENGEQNDAIRQEIEIEAAARRYARVYVRLLDQQRAILIETPGMSERLPVGLFPKPARSDEDSDGVDREAVDGAPFRLLAAGYDERSNGDGRTIQIALDRVQQYALIQAYKNTLLAVIVIAILASILAAYWIAHRGIRPIKEIADTARRIRLTTLHERIESGKFPAELAALAGTFNEMLDRLQESFERLSRFSGDIAHELRTPVNNIRGEGEVALSRTRSVDEYRETLASNLEETVRLSRIIDSLLLLARAESPEAELTREPINLTSELDRLREFYDVLMTEKGVEWVVQSPTDLIIQANRPLLQRAIGNLIENALNHTLHGGTIAVSAISNEHMLRIEVADNGSGIPSADLPHIFDRFYRVEKDRSSVTGGSGLGLAIVRSVAELHGGEVAIDSRRGIGTTVSMTLPYDRGPSENG